MLQLLRIVTHVLRSSELDINNFLYVRHTFNHLDLHMVICTESSF